MSECVCVCVRSGILQLKNHASFSVAVGVYTGDSLPTLSTVFTTSSQCFNCSTNDYCYSCFTVPVTAGTQYEIQVDGYNYQWGPFTLQLLSIPNPTNDNFAARTLVTNGTVLSGVCFCSCRVSGRRAESFTAPLPRGQSLATVWIYSIRV